MSVPRKDKENETEFHMRQVLECEGFRVVRIPLDSKQTADYRVSDDQNNYLLEVKRKEDDPDRLAQFHSDFRRDGKATLPDKGGRTNPMSKIIRDAAEQIESSAHQGDFKIIWFAARGQSPELQIDQFRSTLYGEVAMVTVTPDKKSRVIPCYYYTFNEFYKLPHIDGAIASAETSGGFYLNSFSPRANELKSTKLFKMFEHYGAVWDPIALEATGHALVVDQDTDRRNKAAVYTYLLRKYGYDPRYMLPFEHDVTTMRFGLTVPIHVEE